MSAQKFLLIIVILMNGRSSLMSEWGFVKLQVNLILDHSFGRPDVSQAKNDKSQCLETCITFPCALRM